MRASEKYVGLLLELVGEVLDLLHGLQDGLGVVGVLKGATISALAEILDRVQNVAQTFIDLTYQG